MSDWRERFATLGFRPTEHGSMRGRFEDIDIVAVEHPFNELCLMGSQFDGRHACEFETFIPVDTDFQGIAAALVRIHDLVHPKAMPIPAPEPERKRPSNEEALAKVPDLMERLGATLRDLSFLFQRTLTPEGYLDAKLGEILAAYVYDLELLRNHPDYSEAKSSDGRSIQVRATRATASRETVALRDACAHLLVVQLSGHELIEVYNGPLDLILVSARRVQKDGTRRISMGRLRGRNKYNVPVWEKIERKRTWKYGSTGGDSGERR